MSQISNCSCNWEVEHGHEDAVEQAKYTMIVYELVIDEGSWMQSNSSVQVIVKEKVPTK